MSGPTDRPDPLAAAGLAALLAGAVGLVEPFFLGLALAASSLAGVAGLPRSVTALRPGGPERRRGSAAAGNLALLGAWAIYLAAPGALDRLAGLALGVAALGLWLSLREVPEIASSPAGGR